MDITPLVKDGQQVINSYSAKGFRVAGILYESAIMVTPENTAVWNTQKPADQITIDDFSAIKDLLADIDVLLFGCGAQSVRIGHDLRNDMKAQGIALEAMDSAAACRTYNVLMAEGRRVAVALLPV